ncbi:hypothetical protein AEAC466_21150 [Asticcacaulis sp. AC466]|uniref:hypothetical protein n=1 Tax=Asticcacaulis sp. AC466 TaxID=1282362 RepID=UPI0003C3E7A7|nr:hypothetical protein [Asticcacaulis sp. AC466]ESQ81508.1 hypothetical protein AEAC466_21150 [Asticcacaulis sp. AC466]
MTGDYTEDDERTLLEKAEKLQAGLVAAATQDPGGLSSSDFSRLRQELLTSPVSREKVPDMLRRYRDAGQFWQFIKGKFKHYQERRAYIWDEFRPLMDHLEFQDKVPGIAPISDALEDFDPENVHGIWQKALDRRSSDPEGAITASRTLLETVCKYVLEEAQATYPDDADLPKLWMLASEHLNLAPHQHQEV